MTMRRLCTLTETRFVPMSLALLIAFAAGCASTPEPVEVEVTEFQEVEAVDTSAADLKASRSFKIAPVYFELDKSEVRGEFGPNLRNAATALKESGATVVIAGNCDERGSDDYNLALGESRAGAVRKYLYNLGVPMSQMTIVSYGEARPAVSGTGEAAWRLNRRADFAVH